VQIQTPQPQFLSDFGSLCQSQSQAALKSASWEAGTMPTPSTGGRPGILAVGLLAEFRINASLHLQSASNRYHTHDYYQVEPMGK